MKNQYIIIGISGNKPIRIEKLQSFTDCMNYIMECCDTPVSTDEDDILFTMMNLEKNILLSLVLNTSKISYNFLNQKYFLPIKKGGNRYIEAVSITGLIFFFNQETEKLLNMNDEEDTLEISKDMILDIKRCDVSYKEAVEKTIQQAIEFERKKNENEKI